jgi:hypothetical protein
VRQRCRRNASGSADEAGAKNAGDADELADPAVSGQTRRAPPTAVPVLFFLALSLAAMPPNAQPRLHRPSSVWGLAEQATAPVVRHLFGQLANADREQDELDLNPYVLLPSLHWTSDCREQRLWFVGTDATQVTRQDRLNPMNPLSRDQIQSGSNLPAGAQRTQNRSALQVMVELQRSAGQHRFYMDSNQWVELESECITMTLFGPAGIVEVAPAIAQIGPQPEAIDLAVDCLLGGSVLKIEESTGRNSVLFSQTLLLEESELVPIPPFAHAVRITQASTDAAPVSAVWGQWIGITPGGVLGVPAGRITIADGETSAVLVPNASHLQVEEPGTFTLIWEIRP